MSKLWKALASLAILVLLAFVSPGLLSGVRSVAWLVLTACPITYAISLFFRPEVAWHKRWGMAYLVFSGFTYFLAGIQGVPYSGILEPVTWGFLVSPYPLLTLLRHGIPRSPYSAEWGEIYILPHDEHPLFSVVVLVISVAAIVAGFVMAKRFRVAYRVWLALLSVSVLSTVGYVALGFLRWGFKQAVLPVCLTASYALAYVMARKGVELR